ncbi:hypothetical protein LSUE1_G000129 [Lachnellula suecica]|uniref:Uncharacterized protein n=1 Tax=Lachnellula suecica TaxID=602035 RepID=A0A8T9CN39_9HELO|nr:hypothetical protein LSUE1_G000129 [Lachnellula suecica]
MATVTALPAAERSVSKPARSMTYPLRDPKGNTARRRVKQGEPFDPEELSRRLTAHLAEQKIKAERRREARAAKAAAAQQNGVYHHVPKVAAMAFERTTTPDTMRQVHKLAVPGLKTHLELLQEEEFSRHPASKLQETQAKDQAMIERELLRNRNQFQWTREMEEAVEVDIKRDLYKPPQRTFIKEFEHLRGTKAANAPRPMSTGDVFSDEEVPISPKAKQKPVYDGNDRNDWAQRADGGESRKWASPFLRKKDSIWILGRKEKSNRQDKDETVVTGIGNFGSPPNKKGRFLARFKRRPS